MQNNLIFANGAALPICETAADAPRMGAGFRGWRVEAVHADAVAALESGIIAREYESIMGVDEEGNDEWCVLTIKVPTGSRDDGEAYDGYGMAQQFAEHEAEKAEKAKQAKADKERKIARDKAQREAKAKARAEAEAKKAEG